MDPRDAEKAREETLERLLARCLRQTLSAGGAECPGPEILAAYFDHTLSSSEASQWEAHFSRCARCQQVLAALLASELGTVAVEQHEPVAALAARAASPRTSSSKAESPAETAPARPEKKERTLGRYLNWNWLAPLAAAAVAAAFWLIIRPAPQPSVRVAQENGALAPAEKTVPQAVEPSGQLARNGPPTAPRTKQLHAPTFSKDAVTETRPPRLAKGAPGPPRLEANTSDARATGREGTQVQGTPSKIAGIAGAPTAARPQEKDLAEQEHAAQRKEAVRGSRSGALAEEADKKATGELAKAPARAGVPDAAEPRSQAGTVIVSSAANYQSVPAMIASARGWVMWRVGAGGSIERSLNRGHTWQAQASIVDADLVAGSAPSDTVCWVVGRAGTILRTTDGEHWEKISSPAMLDWTSVKAQDALRAEVSTGRKQVYVTTDGGQTWKGPSRAK